MTATPHSGKEEDYQLFLSLLDSDRFYGKFRDGVHKVDASDLMRRMVKEELVKFDGAPLFPSARLIPSTTSFLTLRRPFTNPSRITCKQKWGRPISCKVLERVRVGFALSIAAPTRIKSRGNLSIAENVVRNALKTGFAMKSSALEAVS